MEYSERKIKNYPISAKQAHQLAAFTLKINKNSNRSIARQHVLDALVECLADKSVEELVTEKLTKKYEK